MTDFNDIKYFCFHKKSAFCKKIINFYLDLLFYFSHNCFWKFLIYSDKKCLFHTVSSSILYVFLGMKIAYKEMDLKRLSFDFK